MLLGDVMVALIVVAIPAIAIASIFQHWFKLKEKRLELELRHSGENGAQLATRTRELEQRIRVLEQIVTDGGAHTAAQIEALRAPKAPLMEDMRR